MDSISAGDLKDLLLTIADRPEYITATDIVSMRFHRDANKKTNSPLQWTPIALRLIEHAPDPSGVLKIFVERFSPTVGTGHGRRGEARAATGRPQEPPQPGNCGTKLLANVLSFNNWWQGSANGKPNATETAMRRFRIVKYVCAFHAVGCWPLLVGAECLRRQDRRVLAHFPPDLHRSPPSYPRIAV